jgi:hypothetical protein
MSFDLQSKLRGRWGADLAHRHLAECTHQAVLPFGRQCLPDRNLQKRETAPVGAAPQVLKYYSDYYSDRDLKSGPA